MKVIPLFQPGGVGKEGKRLAVESFDRFAGPAVFEEGALGREEEARAG